MEVLSFASVSRLYELIESRKISYHPIDHPLFREFCALLLSLRRFLEMEARDEFWAPFFRPLNRYKFQVGSSVVGFDAPALVSADTADTLRRFGTRCNAMHPEAAGLVHKILEVFFKLRDCPENMILDQLSELWGNSDRGAILVKDARMTNVSEEALKARPSFANLIPIAAAEARSLPILDRLIVVGSPGWFPDHVFSAPHASRIDVVGFRWNLRPWRATKTLLHLENGDSPRCREDETELYDDTWPQLDWSAILNGARVCEAENPQEGGPELLEVRAFALAEGYAVFIDSSASCLVIDLEEEGDAMIRRVDTGDVEPGMFLLLRTEGGGADYIVSLADKILGSRARACREAQANWKRALREYVSRLGIAATVVRLSEYGSKRVDQSNLRNWMSGRTIRTHDKEDFAAVMRVIGREAETDETWRIMGEIDNVHRRAGKLIRRRLIEKVRSLDLSELQKKQRLDITLAEADGGGRLTAFRVEARAPHLETVSASRSGHVFRQPVDFQFSPA
jgi:hypothetical protein